MRRLLLLDDKAFYRAIGAIALPIALQNLINFGVSMMDTLMLGLIGEVQLSAAAMANQMSFMFMVLSFGVANGCAVLSAQNWGRGYKEEVKHIVSFMYRVVLGLEILFVATALFMPEQVIRLFIADQVVVAEGVVYLRIVGVSFLFSGFTNATIGILRSVGTVRISVLVYSVSLVVNTFLNWVLIFGNLGAPRLGIEGAALATLLSRVVEFLIIATYLFRFEPKLGFRPSDLLRTGPRVVRNFLRYSTPVLLNETLWSSGSMVVASVIGHMGREVVAANSICSVLFQLSQAAIFGLSNAAATITGNTIGAGEYESAKKRAKTFAWFAAAAGLFASLLMQLIRYPLIGFYNISDLARDYAYGMSAVACVLVAFQTVSMILMMGVLRGGGDTRFVMIADVSFMWLIAIPAGSLAGLWFGLPVPVVYLILKSEDLFKSFLALFRVISGKWVKDVTN